MTTQFRTIVAPAPANGKSNEQWADSYNKYGMNARRNGIDGFLLGYDMSGTTPTGAFAICNTETKKARYLLSYRGSQANTTREHLQFITSQLTSNNYLRCGNAPVLFVRSIEDGETAALFAKTLRESAFENGIDNITLFVEKGTSSEALQCGFDGVLGDEVASITTQMASDPENYRTQVAAAIVRSVAHANTQNLGAALVCSELTTFDEPTFLAHNAAVFDAAEELPTQLITNSILEAANV